MFFAVETYKYATRTYDGFVFGWDFFFGAEAVGLVAIFTTIFSIVLTIILAIDLSIIFAPVCLGCTSETSGNYLVERTGDDFEFIYVIVVDFIFALFLPDKNGKSPAHFECAEDLSV